MIDFLFLWTIFSIIIVLPIWTLCMGDPDSTDLGDKILTGVFAIVGLPATVFILVLFLILYFKIKK